MLCQTAIHTSCKQQQQTTARSADYVVPKEQSLALNYVMADTWQLLSWACIEAWLMS